MSANSNAPTVIKRKKIVAGGGHHGGAWKVAYADFVTAMMAFFMLMWLLNATTETQRKGLADYFSPSIPVMRISGGGDGSFGGDNVFTQDALAQSGAGAALNRISTENNARGNSGTDPSIDTQGADHAAFEKIESSLTAMSGESMVSPDMLRHILTRVTDEGLIVELFDLAGEPLFHEGTNMPTDLLIQLCTSVADVFKLVENEVAVNAFTRSQPIILVDNPVWDLSATRANKTRILLENQGLAENRTQRVTGFADKKPVVKNLMSPRNNRIELILLRKRL